MYTWNDLTHPRGFLFIGDPHVAAKAPGRRIDDYLTTVIGKLEHAAALCHRFQLVPVILGDLIHLDHESSIKLVSRLSRVLRKFPRPPIEVGGNHGKRLFQSSEDDIEELMATLGLIQLVGAPGQVASFDFDGVMVNLHACPHGSDLPARLPAVGDGAVNVLITHHDLAFEGAYPGARPVTEIINCHMLVNGHMHKTSPSLELGGMIAHNPGNIEPLSLDVADHLPAVWEWCPEQMDMHLVQHLLPHDPHCFDRTGTNVAPAEDVLGAVEQLKESAFAKLMGGEELLEAHRTNDASVLKEDLSAVCDTAAASPAARQMMESLVERVIMGSQNATN
jgi:hypothetical protein